MKLSLYVRLWAVWAITFSFVCAVHAANSLYWGNNSGGTIQFGNLDGSGTAASLFAGEGGPCGLAIDPAAGKIYWTNFNSNTVRVANLDGTGVATTLFAEGGSLCGVAIDPANNKIYWANFSSNEIRVGNLDGTGVASTLFTEAGGSGPSGVTIDTVAGLIYWTNQFSDEVRVGNIDGSGTATTLYGGEDNPIGVAIDVNTQLLYWTDLNSGLVRVGAADGSSVSTLFSGESQPGGVAIDPIDGLIYWSTFSPGIIRVGNLDGSGTPATLFSGQSNPLFAAILKAPTGIGAPVISGTVNVGQVLTCSTGDWAQDPLGAFLFQAPETFQFRWTRNDETIPGATSSTFTPTRNGLYRCTVTASNEAGSASQTSNIAFISITVDIDIKPGEEPNRISLRSRGKVAVAILTTAVADGEAVDFDAAEVDLSTVTLGDDDGDDTPVATRPNGSLMASLKDVDGDGDLDLVLQFDPQALVANGDLNALTTELILNGQTAGGQAMQGSDGVSIVP